MEAAEELMLIPSPAPPTLADDANIQTLTDVILPCDLMPITPDPMPSAEGLSGVPEEKVSKLVSTTNNHISVDFGSTLIYPRSCAMGFQPPLPVTKEHVAIADLLEEARSQESPQEPTAEAEDFVEFELSNFSIYIDTKLHVNQLRSLRLLATKKHGYNCMYFDGILSAGSVHRYVQKVPFCELPIGNYGTSTATVGDQIWIRSTHNQKHQREIYYQLKTPSLEYSRFYRPFLWLVDLGKHFVDFSAERLEAGRQVTILDFKSSFSNWLRKTHKGSPEFERWYDQLRGHHDFRSSVAANVDYLWKETQGILDTDLPSLHIFREIYSFSSYKFVGSPTTNTTAIPPTVVTPYIRDCFGHMQVGGLLEAIDPGPTTCPCTPTPPRPAQGTGGVKHASHDEMIRAVVPGSVISTTPDTAQSGTKWKTEKAEGAAAEDRWYALVQRVECSGKGYKVFDVTWLYRPVDTPCGQMKYPWQNELFLSSHCTCDEGANSNIHEDEVLGVHDVDWFGDPNSSSEFFIRQLYQNEDRRFITLRREDLTCAHNKPDGLRGDVELPQYAPGDTVLIGSRGVLEPAEVVEVYADLGKPMAQVRRLLRRTQVDPLTKGTRPNELVYTSHLVHVGQSRIKGRCIVRAFGPGERIPTPYDRGGVGNAFFVTHKQVFEEGTSTLQLVPLEGGDVTLRQGFRPDGGVDRKKLQGLDLFCGCGNLGRGLEDSGAVEVRWANDIWDKAIHTYMANTDPSRTSPFLGSVDDLLRSALGGKFSACVPRPGEVDIISGGSPCPGFSLLTMDKEAPRQIKNRSLIASFASFVDFYRPKYGILENVVSIVQAKARSEDLFSQLICAIVGMGYQVEIMLGNAWSYGAAQSRPRVFLCFAAAGLGLPKTPRPTHSDHRVLGTGLRAGLGKLSNDEYWVSRSTDPTPFRFVSAAEATGDLPDIADGRADICIPFPDHRLSAWVVNRAQVHSIPTQPYAMSFAKAWNGGQGVMTAAERKCYPPEGRHRTSAASRAWSRVHPHGLFNTVTTMCQYTDARVGKALHWKQQRPLTVMEVRRAQGLPDHDVLLGWPSDQWKMVGNAVARQVSTALGLAFREAWLGSLYEGGEGPEGEAELLALDGVALGESASSPTPAHDDDTISMISQDERPTVVHDDDTISIISQDGRPTVVHDDDNTSMVSKDEGAVPDRDTGPDSDEGSPKSSSDSVNLIRFGPADTPATSESETPEVRGQARGTKKRALSQSLVIEISQKRPTPNGPCVPSGVGGVILTTCAASRQHRDSHRL